jgi:hypothetical protein
MSKTTARFYKKDRNKRLKMTETIVLKGGVRGLGHGV